jgi:predicted ATPase
VELTPVSAMHPAQTLAAAAGATERPGQPLMESLKERLRQGPFLLLLDAGPHAMPAGAVAELLAAAPDLVVLATSRAPLGIAGERVIPVGLLSIQREGGQPAEALELFVDRFGGGGQADRRLAADLCARLGGNPLAIELTAARLGAAGLAGSRADLLIRSAGDGPLDGR